jgi:hypothetical protein
MKILDILIIASIAIISIYKLFNIPLPNEITDKHKASDHVENVLRALSTSTNSELVNNQTNESNKILLTGNYEKHNAETEVKINTKYAAGEACEILLARTKEKLFKGAALTHGGCTPNSAVYFFRVSTPNEINEILNVEFKAVPSGHKASVENSSSPYKLSIKIFYTTDKIKYYSCIPHEAQAQLPWPCEDSDWHQLVYIKP